MDSFQFVVCGVPASLQSNSTRRASWKSLVAASAAARWPADRKPHTTTLGFSLTYFYRDAAPDVDNIIKPIQDALNGLVYEDDSLIVDTRSMKYELSATRLTTRFRDALMAFYSYSDFVHIVVQPKVLEYPHEVVL